MSDGNVSTDVDSNDDVDINSDVPYQQYANDNIKSREPSTQVDLTKYNLAWKK